MAKPRTRCTWGDSNPLYVTYHDTEWGVPVHDDQRLFEMLTLEGAQAGLSWITILRKREHYRRALSGFDPCKISRYDSRRVERLLANPGIVRNRLKIESTIKNARAFLTIRDEMGAFDYYIWQFVEGTPKQNAWKDLGDIPGHTAESDAMSRDLKSRGFGFVGSTICYAFMQATGMVNDHVTNCFRHAAVRKMH